VGITARAMMRGRSGRTLRATKASLWMGIRTHRKTSPRPEDDDYEARLNMWPSSSERWCATVQQWCSDRSGLV